MANARQIHADHNGLCAFEITSAHEYVIGVLTPDGLQGLAPVMFQNGPVKQVGVNGITTEVLLAILIDRTEQLNKVFQCRENSIAITKMQEAMMWLEKRTADRLARGVEGQNQA